MRVVGIALSAISFSISFNEEAHPGVYSFFLVLWALIAGSFYAMPKTYTPPTFKVPFVPLLPCFGMLANMHLIGSLGWPAYVR